MANTNAAANAFANTQARVAASQLVSAYRTAKAMLSNWNNANYQTLIANSSVQMDDGSLANGTYPGQPTNGDGRQNITGAEVYILAANLQSFVNTMEANTNLILNQTLQIADGSSRI